MCMKKTLALILVTILCFSMCACDPGRAHIGREGLNDVVRVELIQYENPNQKHFITWVPDYSDELAPFVLENATVLETLPAEKASDFFDALSEKDILYKYYAYDSPKDVCIRLTYQNGDFLIIWANYAENAHNGYIGKYSADGTVSFYWGCFYSLDYYEELVNEFFAYELY